MIKNEITLKKRNGKNNEIIKKLVEIQKKKKENKEKELEHSRIELEALGIQT